ncbi:hypothetical protein GKC56_05470 [Neisseriaceae bacterium PsAf]|nr:hypothetical protein [Neisseriaceae bacterium PsAf]
MVFFLVIESGGDEPEWSNLFLENPECLTLDQIEKVLKEFKITDIDLSKNSELRQQLLEDQANNR